MYHKIKNQILKIALNDAKTKLYVLVKNLASGKEARFMAVNPNNIAAEKLQSLIDPKKDLPVFNKKFWISA